MKSNYERVTTLNKYKMRILYPSTIITFLLTISEKYELVKQHPDLKDYIDVIIAINSVMIVIYLICDFRATYLFSRAERNRALQYLDNSFDTNFAGMKLENYFTQDKLSPGFYKLAVNCFENVFHTVNIIRQMQRNIYFKGCIVITVLFFSAAVGEKGIVRTLIEAILPLVLLQDAIKTAIFITRLETLLESFKGFFSTLKNNQFEGSEPEAMKYVIDYESTLAWASMPLESKIFFKLKDQLATEWDDLKKEYHITE